jgi:threonine/homoserine/homoserine lactone efflux protein
MATGAISTYTTLVGDKQLQVAAIAAVFCAVGFLSSLSWAAVGASIARLLRTPRRRRILNWALGGLLLVSVVQTLLAP